MKRLVFSNNSSKIVKIQCPGLGSAIRKFCIKNLPLWLKKIFRFLHFLFSKNFPQFSDLPYISSQNFSVPPDFRLPQLCYGLKQNQSQYYIIENLLNLSLNSITTMYFGEDTNNLLNALSCIDDM